MTVSVTREMIRYEADTVEELVALVKAFASDDGWVTWCGGEKCPVPDDVETHIKFRNGEESQDTLPQGWAWDHDGRDYDIVAYRVVP